jgi:hypothetical protein
MEIVYYHIDIVEKYKQRREQSLFWLSRVSLMMLEIPYERNILARLKLGDTPQRVISEEYNSTHKKLTDTPMCAGLAHYILKHYTQRILSDNSEILSIATHRCIKDNAQ